MPKIILTPEVYSSWPFDNSTLLLYDEIIIDKNDFLEQEKLRNRSTYDYKVYNFLKLLKDDLKILREIDYSKLLDENDRNEVHKTAIQFTIDNKNFPDIYLIAKQAWFNYSDYLSEKVKYYDDPNEPGIDTLINKIQNTVNWRNRLFKDKVIDTYNKEDFQALKNAVNRTLGKAMASVKIYQKIVNKTTEINYLIHDGKEYEHAFSVATRLLLNNEDRNFLVQKDKEKTLVSDLIYECYKVYCIHFNLILIEKPEMLYNLRKDFLKYRVILDDFQILLGKFSYDYNISRSYVLHNLERILNSLNKELIKLSKKSNRNWGTVSSVSFFNIPIGQLIRLLIEKKVSEKAIQSKIDNFFRLYENKSWKNFFTLLKSFENYQNLRLTKNLIKINKNYFKVRPDWWIDYLPWYEGGSKYIQVGKSGGVQH